MVRVSLGDKYNKLLVKEFLYSDHHHRKYWKCVCDCGNEHTTHSGSLRSGNTKSCGCLSKETAKARRLPDDKGVINQIILQYKRHARDRNIEFLLSDQEAEILFRGECHYCGDPHGNLKKTKNHKGFPHNGADRLDSRKPYTPDNTVSCCGTCNIAKGSMSKETFLDWIKRIYDKQKEV